MLEVEIMTEKDEIKELREELKEIKELLKAQNTQIQDSSLENSDFTEFRSDDPVNPRPKIIVDINSDDEKISGQISSTVDVYFDSVMDGIRENFEKSIGEVTDRFQFSREDRQKMRKIMREARREVDLKSRQLDRHRERLNRDRERLRREGEKHREKLKKKLAQTQQRFFLFKSLSDEELETFFEEAPIILAAIGDGRRLKILKILEDGAKYQGDLSEATDLKGGSFKHHMDTLMEALLVQQERSRGRYIITRLGIEAIKLSEIIFRRYMDEKHNPEVDVEVNYDQENSPETIIEVEELRDQIGDLQDELDDLEMEHQDLIDEEKHEEAERVQEQIEIMQSTIEKLSMEIENKLQEESHEEEE